MPTTSISTDGVSPTLAELIGLRSLAQRRKGVRKGRFNLAGNAASSLRGRGMEYAESREYVAGDDVRHIDWRLTARSGRTHTKLFQAERERLTLLVADTSPLLYFGTRVRFKSVQAARAGAIAVWTAIREGDRVAALRGTHAEPPLSPAAGTRGALRVLDALVRWYTQAPADDLGLPAALESAGRLLRPGSRLVVLAEPRSVLQVEASRWSALAAHHEVVVLLLVDALEQSPPKARLPFASSAAGAGQRVEVDMTSPSHQQAWQQMFDAPLQQARQSLAQRGVHAVVLAAHDSSDAWLAGAHRSQSQVA
ncbi:DUF58 domain-containing protein [Pseudoxanthomonas dokdonensis]|uniref:ATPase n=1 Tax=Pseudoxanthomonas dokdonensis TaxID=344882 RepID=A0A0R0CVA1_9GAMM|nr:DUF58 domain-containing protein [Pseudoxanthomonas dokdonensis]KRG70055.1 ATPase [Pseudoxanthomonas dokdonensis]